MSVPQMPGSPPDLASVIELNSGLLTVPQLQALTGFGRTMIYDMVAAGRIPYLRFGTSIRFDPIAIARWLREHVVLAA